MVEVIHAGGIHEGLVEVGAGVNAARDDELASRINDLGPTRDHELTADLLDDAILNVDICLQRAVVVHHLPPLDEDPHGSRVGEHGAVGAGVSPGAAVGCPSPMQPPGAWGCSAPLPAMEVPGWVSAAARGVSTPCQHGVPVQAGRQAGLWAALRLRI